MVRGRATPASQKSVPPPPYPPPLEQEGYHGLRGQPLHRLPLDLQRNGGNDVLLLSRLRTAANRDQRREDQPADPRQRAAAVAAPRLSADACDVAQGGAALGAGVPRRRARSARLWRQLEAPGRREFHQLFETRTGAGPGRGDGGARPWPLRGRRSRPRRAGDAHRLLRDHPDKVTRGATLDIVPTLYRILPAPYVRHLAAQRG